MEDTCVVCAEELEYCAYGKCGHKEMCHRCSARLRFLGKKGDNNSNDNNNTAFQCPFCKDENEVVMVTRFVGEHTNILPKEKLDQLFKQKKEAKGYHYIPSIQTFYDEYETFQDIRELCSLQHPVLELYKGEGDVPHFRNIQELKAFVRENFKLQFCDLCLKNRKAFVCEQVLYPRRRLEQHYREGDSEGPLAETGFSGHPMCRWCRSRFYNDDMHYQHMERDHFHCNMCRRNKPNKFEYFNKYDDLQTHFKEEHFLCPMTECLEAKFVVFETEPELKRHLAQQHAEQLGMGKEQRRAAMAIPVEFNFAGSSRGRGRSEQQNRIEINFGQRSGYQSRYNRQGSNHQDRAQLQEALRLSLEDDNANDFGNLEEAFPPLGGGENGAGGSTWPYSASSSSTNLTDQDFPSLPGQSRNAKKHARQKAKRQESAQQQQQQQLSSRNAPNTQASSTTRQAQDFPSLPTSSQSRPPIAQQQIRSNAKVKRPQSAQPSAVNGVRQQPRPSTGNSSKPPSEEQFPGLGGKKTSNPQVPVNTNWGSRAAGQRLQQQPRVLRPAPVQPVSRAEAFPTLGQAQERQMEQLSKKPISSRSNQPSSSSYISMLKAEVKQSKNMVHLNEQLVAKIQDRLDADLIEFFRIENQDFMSHEIEASEFHAKLAVLGIVDLVPEYASMLHNSDLREALLDCHALLTQSIDQWNDLSEETKYRIGSHEQLLQEVEVARRVHAWQCPDCHMVNGSADLTCEQCSLKQAVARSMIIAAEGLKPQTTRGQAGVYRTGTHISSQNAWKKPTIGVGSGVRTSAQKKGGSSMSKRQAQIKDQLENPHN
eukprot:TRINITY_DN23528_c1_g1_i6.p1 TRINITY_DN23528_c1_g1~~TRINITY_DN23528_c1_g1_i6.p1  ORF type:complete len:821 (+),score=96.68 TRINITY_DN23528_c1_g1_i6:135-2597(+)